MRTILTTLRAIARGLDRWATALVITGNRLRWP